MRQNIWRFASTSSVTRLTRHLCFHAIIFPVDFKLFLRSYLTFTSFQWTFKLTHFKMISSLFVLVVLFASFTFENGCLKTVLILSVCFFGRRCPTAYRTDLAMFLTIDTAFTKHFLTLSTLDIFKVNNLMTDCTNKIQNELFDCVFFVNTLLF